MQVQHKLVQTPSQSVQFSALPQQSSPRFHALPVAFQSNDSVRFNSVRFGEHPALKMARKMADLGTTPEGIKRKEGFAHSAMRGDSRLNELFDTFQYMPAEDPARAAWHEAYEQIVRYALRDKKARLVTADDLQHQRHPDRLRPHLTNEVLDIRDERLRHPKVGEVLKDLGTGLDTFLAATEDAVIDATGLHRAKEHRDSRDVPFVQGLHRYTPSRGDVLQEGDKVLIRDYKDKAPDGDVMFYPLSAEQASTGIIDDDRFFDTPYEIKGRIQTGTDTAKGVDYIVQRNDVPIVPQSWYEREAVVGALRYKTPDHVGDQAIPGLYKKLGPQGYAKTIELQPKVSGAMGGSISATNTIGAGTLKYAPKHLQERYFPGLANQEFLAAFATTEINVGTNLSGIDTTASLKRRDSGELYWELNGVKQYTTNYVRAGFMAVTAQIDLSQVKPKSPHETITDELRAMGMNIAHDFDEGEPEQVCLIVDLPFNIAMSPQQIERQLQFELPKRGIFPEMMELSTIKGTSQVRQYFDAVEVPVEDICGELGNGKDVAMNGLSDGRAGIAALALGGAKELRNIMLELANRKRSQLGGDQGDMQKVREIISTINSQIAGMEAASELMFSLIEVHGKDTSTAPEANMIKAWSTETAIGIADLVHEQSGGVGYDLTSYYDMQRIVEDIKIMRTIEGVNEAMYQAGAMFAFGQVGLDILDSLTKKKFPTLLGHTWGILSPIVAAPGKRGGLSSADAKAIHTFDKQLARACMWNAKKYDNTLPFQQILNMEAGKIAAEIFALKAAMIKLAKYKRHRKAPLDQTQVRHLRRFIEDTKYSVATKLVEFKHRNPNQLAHGRAGQHDMDAWQEAHGTITRGHIRKDQGAAKKAGETYEGPDQPIPLEALPADQDQTNGLPQDHIVA